MCLYPKQTLNPKYLPNKKNKYRPPECKDERIRYISIGCKECIECRRQLANEWRIRLIEEIKNKKAQFITLTFSDESIKKLSEKCKSNDENEIAKKAIDLFTERWRAINKKSLRHWLITELGHNGTKRIHIHGITITDTPEKINEIWGYGKTDTGKYVNIKTINYIIKYITKKDIINKGYKPIIKCSKGIGSEYTKNENNKKDIKNGFYRLNNGIKVGTSMYWKNKIMTDEEKENKWIETLEKETRYVNKTKINVSSVDGEIEYDNAVKEARIINERITMTNPKIEKERQYERNLNKRFGNPRN